MPIPEPNAAADKSKRKSKTHPWRDNIEAITVSIVIIVLFKYFVLEAYKIPTGSMQPTLMGWTNPKGGGVFDRVLVDKLSFHYRDPERFEVAVFKYPLDRSKNFIKRIWGLPGEELWVRDGDVWVKPPGAEEWSIPERPEPVLGAMLKKLDIAGEWRSESQGWQVAEDGIEATSSGSARFPGSRTTVKDRFEDGYPGKMKKLVAQGRGQLAVNDVGDLRIDAQVTALADSSFVLVVFHEGTRRYTLRVPGPQAPVGAAPELRITDSQSRIENRDVLADAPFALEAGASVHLRAQNIDDRVVLWVDGEELLTEPVPPIPKIEVNRTGITVATEGGGASFEEIEVHRDIYYTSNAKVDRWKLPDDGYVVLGDNTQDSSDSRDWSLARWEMTGGERAGTVIQGNERTGENPLVGNSEGGRLMFLRDEQGERNVFPQAQARSLGPVTASYVPRNLIRGRAVLVVWPIVPSLGVYRLKWVR